MATAPAQTVPVNSYILVNVTDYDADGTTPDTTEALTVTSNNNLVVTAVVNPGNNRQVKITGVGAGATQVVVSAPNVPVANALTIPMTVTAVVNASWIEFNGVQGPFPV
jgi:hypothetical protein